MQILQIERRTIMKYSSFLLMLSTLLIVLSCKPNNTVSPLSSNPTTTNGTTNSTANNTIDNSNTGHTNSTNPIISVSGTFTIEPSSIPETVKKRIESSKEQKLFTAEPRRFFLYIPVPVTNLQQNLDKIKQSVSFNSWISSDSLPTQLSYLYLNASTNQSESTPQTVSIMMEESVTFNFDIPGAPIVSYRDYINHSLSREVPSSSLPLKTFDVWNTTDNDIKKAQSLFNITSKEDVHLLFVEASFVEEKVTIPSLVRGGKDTIKQKCSFFLVPINWDTLASSVKYTIK